MTSASSGAQLLDLDLDLSKHLDELVLDETDDEDEPVLRWIDGRIVDTWRESYPYGERMPRPDYEVTKRQLQIELLKLQNWIKDTGQRLVILFEGRDAAGKGGTIKRFTEHLNPRGANVVALEKPTDREVGEWYYQRYICHLPSAGEMVLFDRSWYNRAGVERVMGYCTDAQLEVFVHQTPIFEKLLIDDGTHLIKFWFSVSRSEQRTRFLIRQIDPVRQWKLSPTDLASINRWDTTPSPRSDVQADRHRACSVDRRQEQRQEAGPHQRHASRAQPVRLPIPRPRRHHHAGPARRRPRVPGVRTR